MRTAIGALVMLACALAMDTIAAAQSGTLSTSELSALVVTPEDLGSGVRTTCETAVPGSPAFVARQLSRASPNAEAAIILLTQSEILSPQGFLEAFLRGVRESEDGSSIDVREPQPQEDFSADAVGVFGFGRVAEQIVARSVFAWKEGTVLALVSVQTTTNDIATAVDALVQYAQTQRDKISASLVSPKALQAAPETHYLECDELPRGSGYRSWMNPESDQR